MRGRREAAPWRNAGWLGVEHMQRASDKWQANGCVTKPCVPSRLERYTAPPSQRWNLHIALHANSAGRGTKKAATHGRSVFRRQSKIHFRGTLHATSPTHVRPRVLSSNCFGDSGLRCCKDQRETLWRDNLSYEHKYRCTVSKPMHATRQTPTSDSTLANLDLGVTHRQ
jgi:hypothetical protein